MKRIGLALAVGFSLLGLPSAAFGQGGNIGFLSSDPLDPELFEDSIVAYLEGQGLTVYWGNGYWIKTQVDSFVAANSIDALYISPTASSALTDPNLTNLTTGVVMSNVGNWEDFELSGNDNDNVSGTGDIVDNTHFITEPFATGNITLYSPNSVLGWGFSGVGSGADVLMRYPGQPDTVLIVAYETGSTLETGNPADGRRVGFFAESEIWGDYTADTKTLIYRSLIWAGGLDTGGGDAVTSATAEISPNDVQTNSTGNEFVYAILATIGGTDTGVDSIEITVPATFGLPTVDSVRVGGSAVTFTDNTSGRLISVNLSTKLTSTDSIQAYFTVNAPTSSDATGVDFTSTVDDKGTAEVPQSATEGNADGDAGDANSWTVTTSAAVSSATAEISPNDVLTNSTGNEFIYAILATIGGDDSGVDRVEITVFGTFGLPTVDSVRVGGTAVTYTDNTGATRTISLDLTAKVTTTDSIQVYFTADAPTSADATGVDFTSTVDDTGDSWSATATTEGNADGDAGDNNSWTVTTTDGGGGGGPGGICPAVDTVSTGMTTTDTIRFQHTTSSGDDRLMLVGVSIDNDDLETVDYITYNGVPLDFVGARNNAPGGGDDARVEIWRLVAPSAGTHDVIIVFTADLLQRAVAGAITFTGVDQGSPHSVFYGNDDDGPLSSVTVNSTEGEMVFALMSGEWTGVPTLQNSPPAIERWNLLSDGSPPEHGAAATDSGAAPNVTISWSHQDDHWAAGGVSIAPAPSCLAAPSISSAANQTFQVGDPTTAAVQITIAEDASYQTITDANNLRIRIPGGLDMIWDTLQTALVIGGNASTKVSATVSAYEDAGKTVVLDVISNFAAADTITVDSLKFMDFGSASAADSLELEVFNDGLVSAVDDKTKEITEAAAVTSATAEISPNDVTTNGTGVEFIYAILATIGGTDTGVDSIEVTVPASFGDPTVDSVRVGGTAVTYTDNTAAKLISITLDTKVTSSDSIQVYFAADAPTTSDATGVNFTSTVDDSSTGAAPQATTEGDADGDAGDNNSWTVTTSGAVSSAAAEISPNDVITNSTGNEFIYAILATITGDDSGVDSLEITVPATFGDPVVDSVRVGGVAVTYTDNTAAKLISLTLDAKVTSTDSIQVYFTADAPTTPDAGVDFTSTVDDSGTGTPAQATAEGSADGDGADANSWTVTTSDPNAVASATAEISPNNIDTGSTGNEYVYAILATIGPVNTGVDSLTITVPGTHGLPTVDSVRVGGTAVAYTDNTGGTRTISINLTAKVTSTDSIQVYFTADAPSSADAGLDFTSTVDDTTTPEAAQATSEGNADGDAGDANSWTVTTSDPNPAVTSATAEISPNDVTTGFIGIEYIYAILATISGGETGVDRVEIEVPSTFGLPTVDSVRVGGTAVTYTDNTGGTRTISVDLTTKVTTTDSIQVYFTADAPTLADPTGKDFTSTVDDSGTGSPAQAASEGSADGDGTDANDWTVTTTDLGGGGGTPAGICPAVDTVFTGSTITDSLSFQHTTSSGPDRLMLVGVSINNDGYEEVSWITYNGAALTRIGTSSNDDDARVEIWQLVAPDAGTHDVVVKFDADLDRSAVVGAITFTGADQTAITAMDSAFADGSTSSVTVSSAVGDLVFAMMSGETTGTPNLQNSPPAVEQWNLVETSAPPEEYGAAATDTGRVSVTVSWTHGSDHWATGGISIAPATACLNAAPTISSNANQVFQVGDPVTVAERIVITEDASYMTITSPNDVRITIPAGLDMIWDTTLTTVTIGGASAGKVSGTLLPFEDNGKTAVINITSDFAGGDQFYIDSLKFMDFASVSAADSLELEVKNDGLVSAVDDKTKEITEAAAVTSATAEISPNDVTTSSTGNEFIYAILATISGAATGVDSVEITVPGTFGLPTVDSVRVGGTAVTYTDNTGGTRTISITLDTKVTSTDSIQVYFTADAPTSADAGVDFLSTVDDSSTGTAPQATTEGNADGDAGDNNSWTVTTTDAPATLLGRYWFNEAPSGQSPTTIYDDQASPVNMSIIYDTPMEWAVNNEHRGLEGTAAGHSGRASGAAAGTKYSTNLDGATQASFVMVAEFVAGAGYTQRAVGFQRTSDGDRPAMFNENAGSFDFRYITNLQPGEPAIRWDKSINDGVRRVYHLVYDTEEADSASRVRLYIDGVVQSGGYVHDLSWPDQGETLDFSDADLVVSAMNDVFQLNRGLYGTVYYFAVYAGELTDAEITSDAAALALDDDNITLAVSVTPDGASVVRLAGTDFSYDFTLNNGSGVLEDFDLLASTDPASSFITIDSITGGGISDSGVADSTRITGVEAGADSTVTVWYTITADTDGNVDTLYLKGRSISDTAQSDLGWIEIEYETIAFTVTPDGADTLQLMPTGTAASSSYKFTITNNSLVSETFDLLAFDGAVLTIDSITGPNVSGGSPGDSARTGAIAASAEDSAFVWFTISVGTAGALDSLYLMGRSVSDPSATDSGWVFVELLQPELTTSKVVNPNGTQPPGTDLTYTLTITNNGTADAVTVVTVDSLAAEVYFKVGSVNTTLPAGMTEDVDYYDNCGTGWGYTPVSGGDGAPAGYDGCVTRIRWDLLNDFSYVAPDNTAELEFVARIK